MLCLKDLLPKLRDKRGKKNLISYKVGTEVMLEVIEVLSQSRRMRGLDFTLKWMRNLGENTPPVCEITSQRC